MVMPCAASAGRGQRMLRTPTKPKKNHQIALNSLKVNSTPKPLVVSYLQNL